MPHSHATGTANLRDKLRPSTNKISHSLRRALSLLNLTSISELEQRVLATTAFLVPWSVYRDSCLLVSSHNSDKSAITRLNILWFYTQFDEGLSRHDLRAENLGTSFEIEKSSWGCSEHEKLLYVWLLQTFCVGKSYSPFGLHYFRLRNICTAWDEVFVPIVKAVCASYSSKGRRHYGRLALFIEERCPSRLAFPEGNVNLSSGFIDSPTTFRMVSRTTHTRGASQTVLTKENYDEAEKELREVYPQYGSLVERPRFKHKMEEWLELQRMRATYRKMTAKEETVQYVPVYRPQIVQQVDEGLRSDSPAKTDSDGAYSINPIKRYSDTIRRSLSVNAGKDQVGKPEPQSPPSPTHPKAPITPKKSRGPHEFLSYMTRLSKREPKSPLHGVTRRLEIPDGPAESNQQELCELTTIEHENKQNDGTWPLPTSRLPRPRLPRQRPPEKIVQTMVESPFTFTEVGLDNTIDEVDAKHLIWSPMGAPSAIPQPLRKSVDRCDPEPQRRRAADPSTSSNVVAHKPRNRLPAPIKVPPPYEGRSRIVSDASYRKDSVSKPATDIPKSVPWPGSEDPESPFSDGEIVRAPPIPAKSAARATSHRSQHSLQMLRHQQLQEAAESQEMPRIVSIGNIRPALGNLTPQGSIEDLKARASNGTPLRAASPPRLET
ncbi:hypothetical protein B5807_09402 [Epicoccum nigrum]|uniref:Uncharacterized protein n=1 Tax=Epicoccum nigrum TaxID=105696 RepID=A0A1Y2LMT1_EPING|nr:hypothetical protein B5807_09402 [Epicoccum nigrum]